ncbi:hypothetical protein NECID01_1806 [Nematocida sp. AWRm77]|nr:hypothetical protein NECID01_1806 [Nematocida sp. AWRm77]
MLPQLELLEIEFLTLDRFGLGLEEEEESMLVFSGLKTLKLPNISNYSDVGIKNLACLFPSLKWIQISSKDPIISLTNALSRLRHLRTLEIIKGSLRIETLEYLLEKLPSLECLSFGVYNLDNKLAHALSKYSGIHTLKLRGHYTPGFLASLLQPSPLMNTLKSLCVWRHSGLYGGTFSIEDNHSKKAAMKNFGCALQIRR